MTAIAGWRLKYWSKLMAMILSESYVLDWDITVSVHSIGILKRTNEVKCIFNRNDLPFMPPKYEKS
jgi:hypothetical protein